MEIRVRRLTSSDREAAQELFVLMEEVFEEKATRLNDDYVDQLLRRDEFWALAAVVDDVIVGGITAHKLPMTRTESSELFVYDIAVQSQYQRMGVGSRLFNTLRAEALEAGGYAVFVAADDDDAHALDFYRALGGKASPVTIFNFPAAGKP